LVTGFLNDEYYNKVKPTAAGISLPVPLIASTLSVTLIENCNACDFFIKWTPGKEHFQKKANVSCCIINEQKMSAIERFIGADLFI